MSFHHPVGITGRKCSHRLITEQRRTGRTCSQSLRNVWSRSELQASNESSLVSAEQEATWAALDGLKKRHWPYGFRGNDGINATRFYLSRTQQKAKKQALIVKKEQLNSFFIISCLPEVWLWSRKQKHLNKRSVNNKKIRQKRVQHWSVFMQSQWRGTSDEWFIIGKGSEWARRATQICQKTRETASKETKQQQNKNSQKAQTGKRINLKKKKKKLKVTNRNV